MELAKTILCICGLLWDTTLAVSDTCPQECSRCNYDNQGQLVKVTCTDIIIQSLPETVKQIHVSDVVSMQTVPFGKLKAFMFSNRVALETLTIQNYKIASIEDGCFKNNNHLRTLDLSKNAISSLTADVFEGLTNLTYLSLNQNQLASINGSLFQHLSILKELHMALNLLINIGEHDFLGLKHLLRLDLQSNKIKSIHPSAFSVIPNLEDINLQNNHLLSVEAGVFKGLNSLKVVNLQNNMIVSLDPDCMSSKSLLTVNLAQNNISSIPTVFLVAASNPNSEVNLARNKIKEIKVNDLTGVHLKTLYLVSNEIRNIEGNAFLHTDIAKIDLEQNFLKTIPATVWRYLNASKEILLGNNPWTCDCKIQWLAMTLKNAVSNAQEPVCAQPSQFFGRKLIDIEEELSHKCKNFSLASLYIPPRHSPVTPELRKTVPPKHSMVTPQLRSTTTMVSSTPTTTEISTQTTTTVVSTQTTTTEVSTQTKTTEISTQTTTTVVSTQTTTTEIPTQTTTSNLSKHLTHQNDDKNNVALIVGLSISIITLLCVGSSVIVYRVVRPVRIIDPELTVQCKKPDTSFRPRIHSAWFDDVT